MATSRKERYLENILTMIHHSDISGSVLVTVTNGKQSKHLEHLYLTTEHLKDILKIYESIVESSSRYDIEITVKPFES